MLAARLAWPAVMPSCRARATVARTTNAIGAGTAFPGVHRHAPANHGAATPSVAAPAPSMRADSTRHGPAFSTSLPGRRAASTAALAMMCAESSSDAASPSEGTPAVSSWRRGRVKFSRIHDASGKSHSVGRSCFISTASAAALGAEPGARPRRRASALPTPMALAAWRSWSSVSNASDRWTMAAEVGCAWVNRLAPCAVPKRWFSPSSKSSSSSPASPCASSSPQSSSSSISATAPTVDKMGPSNACDAPLCFASKSAISSATLAPASAAALRSGDHAVRNVSTDAAAPSSNVRLRSHRTSGRGGRSVPS
mmetsp:Transcript_3042/g.12539  ORF Transcript_3042/g.12539 Transcript_3042/m.12539 type:complete len:311 (+) Transcript_3042:460-1392(+)